MFKLACETGACVIPVVLAGTNSGWPLGEFLLDQATIVGIVGDAISPHNLSPSQLKVRPEIQLYHTTCFDSVLVFTI
jgi:hypothetical protein